MSDSTRPGRTPARGRAWRAALAVVLLASLACNLPVIGRPETPAPSPAPATLRASAAEALPPVLLEADPPAGSQIALSGPLTLTFDQPMDRASVEGALRGEPDLSGRFTWKDQATLSFTPDRPFAPGIPLTITLAASARSASGQPVQAPITLDYTTAGALHLTQALPRAGSEEIDPSTAVVASFNQPVVPLGVESTTLPPAFTLEPSAKGRGEWLNTSTYIFYPQPGLAGGSSYTVRLNPDLRSTLGAPVDAPQDSSWSFATAHPALSTAEPSAAQPARLDAPVVLTFNQSMDPASVAAAFSLTSDQGQAVTGAFDWNDRYTEMTFQPTHLLERGAGYVIHLAAKAAAAGGTPIGADFSAAFSAVPNLAVISSKPAQGQTLDAGSGYGSLTLRFNAPITDKDPAQWFKVEPAVSGMYVFHDPNGFNVYVSGFFEPSRAYTLTVSPDLTDTWGGALGKSFVLRFRTGPADPSLQVAAGLAGGGVLFLTPQDTTLPATATNLPSVSITTAPITLDEFTSWISEGSYDFRQSFRPTKSTSFQQALELAPNWNQPVDLRLTPDGRPLTPGLYYLHYATPNQKQEQAYLGVVSNVHLTLKVGTRDALVWATSLRDGTPIAKAALTIYNDNGSVLTRGVTDEDGLFHGEFPFRGAGYNLVYAVMEQPGQANFSLALSHWDQRITGWDFNLPVSYASSPDMAYLYTDRPIYRPGQTVYFRAVLREEDNARYALLDRSSVTVELFGPPAPDGTTPKLGTLDLPLSTFGTASSQFELPSGAQPGTYQLTLPDIPDAVLNFKVAEYRKPQIDLQVELAPGELLQGQPLKGTVRANYFFGAPAGNLAVHWTLSTTPDPFHLARFSTGPMDTSWLRPTLAPFGRGSYTTLLTEGDTRTAPDGTLTLELPPVSDLTDAARVTLEVTAQDESGLPVSARADATVHPSAFYAGIRPDSWSGQAGVELGFDILTTDWEGKASPNHSLAANFQKVTWKEIEDTGPYTWYGPTQEPVFTSVATARLRTDETGMARLAFTPKEPGTYVLDLSGEGAHTQALVWVGGSGQPVWPRLPDQHILLTPDAESYRPGQTARIFVPNPLQGSAQALVTVERGRVMRAQVLEIAPGGQAIPLPLGPEDAPNAYVSVVLLGRTPDGGPDFRVGYVSLAVAADAEKLNVELTADPASSAPGAPVTLSAHVTDDAGQPVEGEFSLALVDRAVLALADPNAPPIFDAFYGTQPLGVETGMGLAAYAGRALVQHPGVGGGGGGDMFATPIPVREKFPDTALWRADLVTDADGRAEVSLKLPDSLTAWQALLRGLTADTRVGEASTQITASKPLMVQPATPRFLVAGDHTELATVVFNNTRQDLRVSVSLDASGVALDDPQSALQTVNIPAGSRARVGWWVTAQDEDQASLVFSARADASGGALQDAARPQSGNLPILRYSAPQTYATAGVLAEGGERLEVVALPRSYTPTGGQLDLELSPSLAAAMLSGLDTLEVPEGDFTEALLSSFLPNLEAYRALKDLGVDAPGLKQRLDARASAALGRLIALQKSDGGWSWSSAGTSDPYLSAYVLFGLTRAKAAGFDVAASTLSSAVSFIKSKQSPPSMQTPGWKLDRMAFQAYALQQAGAGDAELATQLYDTRDRISPWGRAYLALALDGLQSGSQPAQTLISDLEAGAIRSATGAHWEDPAPVWQTFSTTISTSAITLYAIARLDPAAPLLPDAVRYLMAHRTAHTGWGSTYETAWVILSLAETLKGTGDLNASYTFGATLNRSPLADGRAGGPAALTPVTSSVPLDGLLQDAANALRIQRDTGPGRLYYRASLRLDRPAETAAPIERGFSVSRAYYLAGQDCRSQACSPIQGASLGTAGAAPFVTVRLTLTVPNDTYYVQIEDYIPAGAEVLDTTLKASQQVVPEGAPTQPYDPRDPFARGWGWWLFSDPRVYDDHVAWSVEYLPAGTYELTYTLVPLQAGEFRLLPARAWETFFPEVQGTSAGGIFTIRP